MKTRKSESVLQDWIPELTFQAQALLMTAIRGADGISKYDTSKSILRYLRGTCLKAAGDWTGKNDNDFMWGEYEKFETYAADFWKDHDALPHHFLMHLVHSAEVIGYKHPDKDIADKWLVFYFHACDSFHMHAESCEEMDKRLNDFGVGYHNMLKAI